VKFIIKENNFEFNPIRFIDTVSDLNILTIQKNEVGFSHELYQEYLAAEYLVSLYRLNREVINEFILDENWLEPLVMFKGLNTDSFEVFRSFTETNIFLAAKSYNSNVINDINEEEYLLSKIQTLLNNSNNYSQTKKCLSALIEIGKFENVIDIINESKVLTKKEHRPIIESLIEQYLSDSLTLHKVLSKIISTNNQTLETWFWSILLSDNFIQEFMSLVSIESNLNLCLESLFRTSNRKKIVNLFFTRKDIDINSLDTEQILKLAGVIRKGIFDEEKIKFYNDFIKKYNVAIEPLYYKHETNCIIEKKFDYGIRIFIPDFQEQLFLSKGDTIRHTIYDKMKEGETVTVLVSTAKNNKIKVEFK
jgi:hypothetical protein